MQISKDRSLSQAIGSKGYSRQETIYDWEWDLLFLKLQRHIYDASALKDWPKEDLINFYSRYGLLFLLL